MKTLVYVIQKWDRWGVDHEVLGVTFENLSTSSRENLAARFLTVKERETRKFFIEVVAAEIIK